MKHPTTRLERLKLSEQKDKNKETGASKTRRRQTKAVREKEAEDAVKSFEDQFI